MQRSLRDRMIYETSCEPKRKDHRQKHEEWCTKIDEITPDLNYYKFYKSDIIRLGYIVECQVTNYRGKGGTRTYVSRSTSCIEGLKDIYKQIRDML